MSQVTKVRTTAWSGGPGCHGGCGMILHIKDGRVIKAEGDPDHPRMQGRVCPRGLAITQSMYHPDRLLYPLKRAGARGEGKWQRIPWDEAYDTIEAKYRQIREETGPQAVVFYMGTGRDIGGPMTLFAYAYGSPNWVYGLSGDSCYSPRLLASISTVGDFVEIDQARHLPKVYDEPGWQPPKLVINWGRSETCGCTNTIASHVVVDMMQRGAKLIVVDPRCTWLASRAGLWLQVRPATDGALALGMLHVIINEGLYDRDFVDQWTFGFERLKERVQEYPPSRVSEITWVPAEKIVQAARMYAGAKPAAINWGLAIDQNKAAISVAQAILSLITLTGNLDVPGGNEIVRAPYWAQAFPFSIEDQKKIHGEKFEDEIRGRAIGSEYPIVRDSRARAHSDKLLEQMETGTPYPIRSLWIQTSNPLACIAMDPRRHYEAFMKVEFNVVVDIFMTPTAMACADIVLPAAMFPERKSFFSWFSPLGAIVKAVEPLGECKDDWEINFTLAKRLAPEAVPENSVEEVLDRLLSVAGVTYKEFAKRVWIVPEEGHPTRPYHRYTKGLLRGDGEPGFNTPTGKVELYNTTFEQSWGVDPLPHFQEPEWSHVSTPELAEKYPLILNTGGRSSVFFHSEHRQIPWLRELDPDPIVEIHPQTARSLDIQPGDWVWIENWLGKCRRRAKVTPTIHPKVVHAPHGWWFPERPGPAPSFFGVFETNVNQLIPMGHHDPWGIGGAPHKHMLCRIFKDSGA